MDKDPRSIVEFLGEIEDPRLDNANRRHEFIDILVIALCGMRSSADDWYLLQSTAERIKTGSPNFFLA